MDGADRKKITVAPVLSRGDYRLLGALFREYRDSLGVDLSFQDFDRELQRLSGEYGPPRGRAFLACNGETPAGCAALRRLDRETGEMKRLYVRPDFQGGGLGRRLAEAVVAAARDLGYRRIRLDTLAEMDAARALYRSMGFYEIEAYRVNPLPGASFMELVLEPRENSG